MSWDDLGTRPLRCRASPTSYMSWNAKSYVLYVQDITIDVLPSPNKSCKDDSLLERNKNYIGLGLCSVQCLQYLLIARRDAVPHTLLYQPII